jgi:four helix bundle protein
MKYQKFEDLPVWNTAIELAVGVFALTETGCLSRFSGFRDQIERATVSISNNIAEGFERGTHEELLSFLYIARGSAGEVRSMLCLMERLTRLDEFGSEVAILRATSLSVTRQLNAWLDSLKNKKGLVGPRHQTEARRQSTEANERRDQYLAYLRRVQENRGIPTDQGTDIDQAPA